ncbi:MAG: hypothetical protein AB7H80_03725 [Candidatus Kapaibacterium sp.]
MAIETLETEIEQMTVALFQIARSRSWNKISDSCSYIISEIKESDLRTGSQFRRARRKANDVKSPMALQQAADELRSIYYNLHDVNLYIYKAVRTHTIVEIQYYSKSSLSEEYLEEMKDNTPTFHSKVTLPPYIDPNDKERKFNINWELGGGLRHCWNCCVAAIRWRKLLAGRAMQLERRKD